MSDNKINIITAVIDFTAGFTGGVMNVLTGHPLE